MSTSRVCDITCGGMHELAIALDKAGFTAPLVYEIIQSKGNRDAKLLYDTLRNTRFPKDHNGNPKRFEMVTDFGIIEVPDNYDHKKWLYQFRERYKDNPEVYNLDEMVSDFRNPAHILKPGDRLSVTAWQPTIPELVTREDKLNFLKVQSPLYTGAHGLCLVWMNGVNRLKRDKMYASFASPEMTDSVPCIYTCNPTFFVRSNEDEYGFLTFHRE